MADRFFDWNDEDTYWRGKYNTRPYFSREYDYDFYRPAYRYGFDAAHRYPNRAWVDVEPDLMKSWSSYEHRGQSTWEQIKEAVRDAWDRVTGHHPVGAR